MIAVLRTIVSLLVIVAFVAIGALIGTVFSLPSGGLGAAAGGGHGSSSGYNLAHQQGIVLVGGASGLLLALAVAWGIWRNYAISRWLGAASVSALAILLACLIPAWHYPFMFEIAALSVPLLCAGFLYAESKGNNQSGRASLK
jgi:hypothetical protein